MKINKSHDRNKQIVKCWQIMKIIRQRQPLMHKIEKHAI